MNSLKPQDNIIAGGAAALATALATKYSPMIGITIPAETCAAVGLIVAHAWDVWTGQTDGKGEAPPPPIAPPAV